MRKNPCAWMLALAGALGCGSTETGGGAATGDPPAQVTGVRGDRYCEILIGTIDGTDVHIDVYNTYQLNDCSQAAWESIDTAAIKAEHMADVVILNGPRYWTMDAFEGSKVVDPAVKTFGTIEMRLTGRLDVPLSEVMGGETSYVPRDVARTTTWEYDAGKPVFELVDPAGRIFDMQSYSVQQVQQTEASLADLGGTLALPTGWSFRSRVLDAELRVTAVGGVATVVRDDLENTYQLSQQ